MMSLDAVDLELLRALTRHDVRYLVIGGHAVQHYGVDRPAKDLDVLIDATPDNAARVLEALATLNEGRGVTAEQLSQPRKRMPLPNRWCEIITSVSIPFTELFEARVIWEQDGIRVPVVSRAHLLKLKKTSGRPIDMDDYRALGGTKDES